jgi:flagellin
MAWMPKQKKFKEECIMRINHNLMAMNTHRQLGIVGSLQSKSMEKLSSGMRINRAGDDAAGLSISEKMRAQIRGLNQASRNAQDGISLIQTAEGALQETQAILQRMRELAVQSASDTNVSTDRTAIQSEIDQLAAEITRIAKNTNFNEQNLLDGTFSNKIFHIGANADQNLSLSINNMDSATLQVANLTWSGTATVGGPSGDTAIVEGGASTALDASGYTGPNGDVTFKLGSDFAETTTYSGTLNASSSADNGTNPVTLSNQAYTQTATLTVTFTDAGGDNIVTSTSELAVTDTNDDTWSLVDNSDGTYTATNTTTSGNTFTFNIDAFENNGESFQIDVTSSTVYNGSVEVTLANGAKENITLTNFDPKTGNDTVDTSNGLKLDLADNLTSADAGKSVTFTISGMTSTVGTGGIRVDSQANANIEISTIQNAIETVSSERSKLGAIQNRLEHTIKNLDTSAENLQAAESRIRDVDMAKEMMEFTKMNILQQAAQAMLAQANQVPSGVLQLLR